MPRSGGSEKPLKSNKSAKKAFNAAARKRAVLKHVRRLPDGPEMLEIAKQNGVSITVREKKDMPKAAGRLVRSSEKPSKVEIADKEDTVAMAMTLWHELRHVRQMHEWGRLAPGNTGRLNENTAMTHILHMMIEADAYTSQTLTALRLQGEGTDAYFAALAKRDKAVFAHIHKFLADRPYDSFDNDGAFSRALFRHLMTGPLDNYSRKYFKTYQNDLEKAETLVDFRELIAKRKTPAPFEPTAGLTDIYSLKSGAALRPLEEVAADYIALRPRLERHTLEKIDALVAERDTMSAAEYKKRRADNLKRIAPITAKLDRKNKKRKARVKAQKPVRTRKP